ncbi:hypothetical protein TNCV_1593811 [Trichonephila clavipes]|nr:hypothetical protein TNCV_1593811 [Trichonephila clavipes]
MNCDPWEGLLSLLYLCFLDDTDDETVLFIPSVGIGVGLFWSPCSDPCRDFFLHILDRFLSVLSTDPFDLTLHFNLGSSNPHFPYFFMTLTLLTRGFPRSLGFYRVRSSRTITIPLSFI